MSPFTFNSSQKKGILVLLLLLLGIAVGKWGWNQLREAKSEPYVSSFPAETSKAIDIQPFDINRADSATWAALPGIGPVLSKRILSYRHARKGFKSIEDLKKVYGLKPEVYEKISPYLQVDEATKSSEARSASFSTKKKYPKKNPQIIDINAADSTAFAQLPGIGAVLSARIIKYRTAKKGFQSIEEIATVYGLKPETYDQILPFLRIQDSPEKTESIASTPHTKSTPVSIDINLADSAQWIQLPGIGKTMTPRIIKFRKLLGHFAEPDQLLLVYGMSQENYDLAKPYLKVGDLSGFDRMDINQAEWKHFVKYPFVTKKLANSILKSRKSLGAFSSWEEVGNVPGLPVEVLRYLQYYFRL